MHQLHFRKEEKLKPWSISSPNRHASPMRSKKIRIVEEPESMLHRSHKKGRSKSPSRTIDPQRLKVRSTTKRLKKYFEPTAELVLLTSTQAEGDERSYPSRRLVDRRLPYDSYQSVILQSIKRKHSQNNSSMRYNQNRFNSQFLQQSESPRGSSLILSRLNKSINKAHHKRRPRQTIHNRKTAPLIRFLKRVVRLIKFWYKLTKFCSKHAKKRRLKIQNQFNSFDLLIQEVVRHYNQQLYFPLKYYRELIKSFMRTPNCYYNDQALKFLNSLVGKLKSTGLPSGLLDFFKSICLDRSFVPSGLLSKFELKKLSVSPWFGCSTEMTPEASCLIIGHVMCCRVVCNELLFQPWQILSKSAMKKLPNLVNSKKSDQNEYIIRKEDFWRYKKIVYDIGSAFYTIYIRHFHRQLPNLNDPRAHRVRRNLNLKYPEILQPFPQNYEREAPKNERELLRYIDGEYKQIGMGVIPSCNSNYYRILVEVDDERVEEVRLAMVDWLMRIYNKIVVIKEKDDSSLS